MITIVKKLDTTYGGYDYVEFDSEKKVYKTGQTRAHRGHYPTSNQVEVEVYTLKELRHVQTQLELQGFTNETKTWEGN